MPAVIFSPTIEQKLAEMETRLQRLEANGNTASRPPTSGSLIGTGSGSGVTATSSLVTYTATNVGFTVAGSGNPVAHQVLIIGTINVATLLSGSPLMNASIGHDGVWATLQQMSFYSSGTVPVAASMTSIWTGTLTPGAYTAQWRVQGPSSGTTSFGWATYVLQLDW